MLSMNPSLVVEFTRLYVILRYRNTFLGYAWSLMMPLSMAVVFTLAFSVIMRVQIENYSIFLITALFPWYWIARSLTASTDILVSNAAIIKKVSFPKETLIGGVVVSELVHFIVSLPVIAGLMLYAGRSVPWTVWLLYTPVLMLLTTIFLIGIGLALAAANVFARDIGRLLEIVLQIVFYGTPIIYREDMVPERFAWVLYANPFAPIVSSWRSVLLDGGVDTAHLLLTACYAAVSIVAGAAVFERLKYRFAEAL